MSEKLPSRTRNWAFGIPVVASSLLAIYFVVKGNINLAVLFMTLVFVFTNSYRAITFKERGMGKEAKWMKGMAIFFAVAFAVVLIIILT
ncbi:hypothetical protein ACFO0S_07395 [Chryseomicrobium palamuruense]|uniref:Aspartyl/asparaginyl-tRNA synthetase n=1 Tax=Chryseomicrobium palamuruense TaxID=682973 RepID=A0ABV8UWS0_9BACL